MCVASSLCRVQLWHIHTLRFFSFDTVSSVNNIQTRNDDDDDDDGNDYDDGVVLA